MKAYSMKGVKLCIDLYNADMQLMDLEGKI